MPHSQVVLEEGAVPGAVIAIHTFSDFLGWHPHLHIICTDGCFYGNGMFRVAPLSELKHLEAIFRHKVFTMLLSKEDSDELIPSILEPDGSSKEFRRNWARLIQKIYETAPLCCPRCQGRMRVIAFIEDDEVNRSTRQAYRMQSHPDSDSPTGASCPDHNILRSHFP